MACAGVFRSKLRPTRFPLCRLIQQDFSCRRSFFSLPTSEVITLSESRVLPYKSSSLYALISDVDSYSSFLPYCQESRITKWSSPDREGKRWPEEADLKIGWGAYDETFTSKLNFVPDTVVEALGGEDVANQNQSFPSASPVFKSLSARWTVTPFHGDLPQEQSQAANPGQLACDRTKVHLGIVFQFSNPLYGALSKTVAPKVAEVMIEAFEKKAKQSLD